MYPRPVFTTSILDIEPLVTVDEAVARLPIPTSAGGFSMITAGGFELT